VTSKAYTCRYCETHFVPKPGKPGYVDECPECLHKKTHPEIPPDLLSRYISGDPARAKIVKKLRRDFESIGFEESKVDGLIADVLNRLGTQA